jgi:hypothetical protein
MSRKRSSVAVPSKEPIDKVKYNSLAVLLVPIVLALIKHYVWPDLPVDLEQPLNVLLLGVVSSGAALAVGWWISLKRDEIPANLPPA